MTQRRGHLKPCKRRATCKCSYKFTGKYPYSSDEKRISFLAKQAIFEWHRPLHRWIAISYPGMHLLPTELTPDLHFCQIREPSKAEFSWMETVQRSSLVCQPDLEMASCSLVPLAWWQRVSEVWFGLILFETFSNSLVLHGSEWVRFGLNLFETFIRDQE